VFPVLLPLPLVANYCSSNGGGGGGGSTNTNTNTSSAEAAQTTTRRRGRPLQARIHTSGTAAVLQAIRPRPEVDAPVGGVSAAAEEVATGGGRARGRPRLSWSKKVNFDNLTESGKSRRWRKTGAIASTLAALKTVGATSAQG
jgi:hypothetical protein